MFRMIDMIAATAARDPRTSGPHTAVRWGAPTFAEMRKEMDEALVDLEARLGPKDSLSSASRDALEAIETLAAGLNPDNSVKVKHAMRVDLWTLRQSYETTAQGNPPMETRRSLERLRSVCLDNTWESTVRACPVRRYDVRPRMSHVPNYGAAGEHVTRGGMPTQEGADWLVSTGRVGVVVNLMVEQTDGPWAPVAWKNVQHYDITVQDFTAPSYEQLVQIIDILDHPPEDGNVFIHCKAGVGRTGVSIACWRITHGWDVEHAIAAEALHSYDASLSQAQAVRDFAERWKREHR